MTSEPQPTDVLHDRLDAERAALIREFAATTPASVVEGYVAAVVAQYKDAQVLASCRSLFAATSASSSLPALPAT